MTPEHAAPIDWSPGRFWLTALGLFAAQAALIFVFAERTAPRPALAEPAPATRLFATTLTDGRLARTFFAEDPSLFPSPSLHGFSGKAWLGAAPEYQPSEASGPDTWLTMDTNQLRSGDLARARGSGLPFDLTQPHNPLLDTAPAFLAPATARAQSVLRLEGALAGRALAMTPTGLGPWPSAQLLGNSVVEIAVGPSGQALSAALISGCGLAEADAAALASARALRFEPTGEPGAGAVWGEAVYSWQTQNPAP